MYFLFILYIFFVTSFVACYNLTVLFLFTFIIFKVPMQYFMSCLSPVGRWYSLVPRIPICILFPNYCKTQFFYCLPNTMFKFDLWEAIKSLPKITIKISPSFYVSQIYVKQFSILWTFGMVDHVSFSILCHSCF